MRRILTSRSWIATIFRMLVIFVVIGTAMAMIFENRLIYFPRKDGPYDQDYGFPVQYVTFKADDGVSLSGAFCPVEHARGSIMWCHGNGGNLSYGLRTAGDFRKLGLSVFLFDYRGYGKSEGSPHGKRIMGDAGFAYRDTPEHLHVAPGRLVVMGESVAAASEFRGG